MRKYIIFLILLSIVKNRALVPCSTTMDDDWYRSGKCQNPDGTWKERYQHLCWACIEAPTPRLGALIWAGSHPTTAYLPGRVCPIHTGSSTDFYVWDPRSKTYPPRPQYAKRKFEGAKGYGSPKTVYEMYEGHFIKDNPCSSITSASAPTLPTRQFSICIYSLMCEATHEAEIRYREAHPHLAPPARVKVKAPPAKVKAATGKKRKYAKRRGTPVAPPRTASSDLIPPPPPYRSGLIPPLPHHRASSDFDDMLHYYIGDISDYLNNEYTDYDGYDLDDQFGEMLMDMYMEGYKAGLNVKRKCS